MIKNFANEEFLKGDRPIATPIPIEIRVFVSIKIRILIQYYQNIKKFIKILFLNPLIGPSEKTFEIKRP